MPKTLIKHGVLAVKEVVSSTSIAMIPEAALVGIATTALEFSVNQLLMAFLSVVAQAVGQIVPNSPVSL